MSDTAAKLDALRSYTHAKDGVTEEFLEARLGPARAFALLSAPAGRAARDAWILCPSIGQEHGNLRRVAQGQYVPINQQTATVNLPASPGSPRSTGQENEARPTRTDPPPPRHLALG